MLTALWTLLAVVHFGAAAAASLHVLFFYQRPAAAVAWLFALWGLPLVGSLAYLCLALMPGRPSIRSKRREAAELRRGRLREGDVSDAYGGGLAAAGFAHLTQRICSLPLTRGNRIELIESDAAALQRQLDAIASARHEVLLQTYVLKPGRIQERLFAVLAERAAHEVGVRLLIDPIGSQELPQRVLAAIRAEGVATHTFLRPDPLKGRFQINYRNHRKILCVDGAVAFTGGRNWSDEYYSQAAGQTFRDTTVELRGPAVAGMRRVFFEDWMVASGETGFPEVPGGVVDDQGDTLVRVLPFGCDEPRDDPIDLFGGAFRGARESIFVATPYFVPGAELHRQLRLAALSGVEVELLLPRRCEKRSIDLAARHYFGGLLEAGARIHLREPPLLHSKAILVDGVWSSIGSVNFDSRSFRLNYELNLEVVGKDFATALRRYFDADIERSSRVSLDEHRARGARQRLLERSAALFEPLM